MEPYRFGYTLYWTHGARPEVLARTASIATRVGVDPRDPGKRQFVIDFDGPRLIVIPETDPPQAIASCSDNAAITECQVFPNPYQPLVARDSQARAASPATRTRWTSGARLKKGEEIVSETWTYLWSPP